MTQYESEVRLGVRVPKSLREAVAREAVLSGKSMADVICEAIDEALHQPLPTQESSNAFRIIHDDSLQPGTVLINSAAFEIRMAS